MTEGVDQPIRLRPGAVTWHEADGEVIALDLQSSEYLGVNPAGAALWARLVDGATEDELVGVLQQTFGVDRDRALGDVRSFLADARARNLLDG